MVDIEQVKVRGYFTKEDLVQIAINRPLFNTICRNLGLFPNQFLQLVETERVEWKEGLDAENSNNLCPGQHNAPG